MTSLRLWLLLAAALALGAPVAAQPVGSPQNITVIDSGTACVTAPTACATFALDSATGSLSIGITGTWTGTLTFEGTNGNSIWTSVVAVNLATGAQATTTTASGLFSVTNAGVIAVRARATAAITGTAIVTAARGIGFTRLFGPSPTFTTVLLGDGTAAAPSLAFASDTATGFYRRTSGTIAFGANSQDNIEFLNSSGAQIRFGADGQLAWGSVAGNAGGSAGDLFITRDAANTSAQRNGTNAQQFNLYKSYTDASNNAKGFFVMSGANLVLGVLGAGTGVGTVTDVLFQLAGTNSFKVSPTGFGYVTGVGGAVTQATSRTTGVTLNTVTGDITLFSAAGSATAASFVVTDSAVAITDNIVINQKSGTDLYQLFVTNVAAGSFKVTFFTTGGVTVEQPVFHFSVIKGVSS